MIEMVKMIKWQGW